MNRNTIIIIGMLTLLASLFGCREAKKRQAPRGEGLIIPATPVKDYPGGGMGSVYALLATLEAEHLSRGDSVNLSAPYLVRCWLKEQALSAYFSGQSLPEHLSCPVPVGMHLLSTYGLYPYDSYPERDGYQQSVTVRKLQSVIEGARKRPTTLSQLSRRIDDVLDRAMGYLPADRVHFLGADYTPGEFARSVCSPDEYLRLVSFPSLPFSSITDRLKSNCMSVTFLCVPSVLGCFKSSMFWGVTTALSLSDSWFSSLMASLMSVIVCLMNSFSSIIYRANPSQQCADRKITNLNTVVYVLYCCKGAIMLFLFGTAKISILFPSGQKESGMPYASRSHGCARRPGATCVQTGGYVPGAS